MLARNPAAGERATDLISIPEATHKYARNRQWFIAQHNKGVDIGRCRYMNRVHYDRVKLDAYMKTIEPALRCWIENAGSYGIRQPKRNHDCAGYPKCLGEAAKSDVKLACDGCGRYLRSEVVVY